MMLGMLGGVAAWCAWMRNAKRNRTRRRRGDRLDDDDGEEEEASRPPANELESSWCPTQLLHKQAGAAGALGFLIAVAVSKTLLTKLVFTHVPPTVAFSVLSCIATNLCLAPCLLYSGRLRLLTCPQLPGFIAVCAAIAVDLACTNVALAILSIALQQCIKATSPTATVLVESLVKGKRFHGAIYAVVLAICIGPILVTFSPSESRLLAESESGSQAFGVLMMVAAVVGGAFKYVLAHQVIVEFREHMGVLAFTFWVEFFVGVMLLPWALLTGEARLLLYSTERSLGEWLLLWGTAAFGGVRILSEFCFLAFTSATSLAMSSLTVQALTILVGIVGFGTPLTPTLALGVVVTLLTSALYAWLRTSKVLEQHVGRAEEPKPSRQRGVGGKSHEPGAAAKRAGRASLGVHETDGEETDDETAVSTTGFNLYRV